MDNPGLDDILFSEINNEGIAAPPEAIKKAQLIASSDVDEVIHDGLGSKPDKNRGGRITINACTSTHSLTEHTDMCVKAITTVYNNPHKRVFVRSGAISGIFVDENNAVSIKSITDVSIRGILDQCCNFVLYQAEKKKGDDTSKEKKYSTLKTRPPIDVCKNISASSDMVGRLPALKGMVEAPYIMKDGIVVTKPGYCDQTGLYFAPGPDYKEIVIPDTPTPDDVKNAVDEIGGLFVDFKFDTTACKDNLFAALFTSVLRPVISGCIPMFLVDKPQMGTGGSLVCEIINRISTGKPLQPNNAPKNNESEEWEKRIMSILSSGIPAVCFDNIETNFHSASLASVITAEKYQGRLLGSSNTTVLDARVFWFGNGINLNIQGDMPRRIYMCRIITDTARPQNRTGFKIPQIKQYVLDHRYEYIRDILIIAKAYHNAGCPIPSADDKIPAFGSFEAWRDYIGGMMVFIGCKEFLGNMEDMLSDIESKGTDEENLLEKIYLVFGSSEFLSSAIINDKEKRFDELLPPYILDEKGSKVKKLGNYFSRMRDRVFPNGYKIRLSRSVMHVQRWEVVFIKKEPANEPAQDLLPTDTRGV
jgi:hypothetical protein